MTRITLSPCHLVILSSFGGHIDANTRQIHARRAARPGRHGRGLPLVPPAAQPPGRGQGHARRASPPTRRRTSASCARPRSSAALSHPNIVNIFDVDVQDGQPYIVMDFAAGGSLAARLQAGPMPLDETHAAGDPAGRGARLRARQGLIHRDLKPAMCCCSPTAARCWPTSGWRAGAARQRRADHRDWAVTWHAGLHGARAVQRPAAPTRAPISTRWA